MDIYILRHAEAEPRGPGIADADRALTARGKRDLRAVLALAARAKVKPRIILSSPLQRARQTAAAAAKVFKTEVVETRHLLPAARPDHLWRELGAMPAADSMLLAGHEPHLGNFIRFLLESAVAVDLKKGALVRIEVPHRIGPPRGVLKWMMTPRLVRRES
jgi:phosphohistidine phosphatase